MKHQKSFRQSQKHFTPLPFSTAESSFKNGFESGPYLLAPKSDSIVIAFEALQNTDAKIYYGTSADAMQEIHVTAEEGAEFQGKKMHLYRTYLKNLQPNTSYQYRVALTNGPIESGSFKTLRENPDKIHFVVISDTHKFETASAVNAYLLKNRPDFILHTGDMVEGTGTQKDQFRFWFRNGTDFIKNIPVIYNCGNHDYGIYFNEYITKVQKQAFHANDDGTDISFDYGNVHFTMMNSNPWALFELNTDSAGGNGSAETHAAVEKALSWLSDDLASANAQTADFRIVTMHHPYEDDYTRKYIPPIAEKYGVHILFGGHTHVYARTASANPAVGTNTLYVTQGDARIGSMGINVGTDDTRIDANFPEVLAVGKGDLLDVTIQDGILTYQNLGLKAGKEQVVETVTITKNGSPVSLRNITITPDRVLSNGTVTVTATATNIGKGLAAVSLPISDNGTTRYLYVFGKKGSERVIALNPAESKTVSAELCLTGLGTHTLKLGDYSTSVEVTYRAPTFVAENLRTKLGNGTVSDIYSDILYAKADITNIGNDSGTMPVSFYVNGNAIAAQSVTLAAGQTQTIEFVHKFDTYGNYTINIDDSPTETISIAGIIQGTPIVKDQSGHGNDGIIRGNPTLILYDGGYGLALDGKKDYVEIPDHQNYIVEDGVTGMVWANINRLAAGVSADWDHNPLLMKGASISYGTNYLYRMAVRATGKLTYGIGFDNDNGEYFWNDNDEDGFGAQLHQWTQYTGGFDRATGGTSYENAIKSGEIAAPDFDSAIKNWFGCSMYAGASYHRHLLTGRNRGKSHTMLSGGLGQIRFYITKLTAEENAAIYQNPSAIGPHSDKLMVWLDFDPAYIITTGTHTTEWVSVGTPKTLSYTAKIEGKSALSVRAEVSADGSTISSSQEYPLTNGTGSLDLSTLGDTKYIRLVTTFDSSVTSDSTDIPQVLSYTLTGSSDTVHWATLADWNRGTYADAAGYANQDFFKTYANDFDNYAGSAVSINTADAAIETQSWGN